MKRTMSLQSRKELLESVRLEYNKVGCENKSQILDGFIAATGYKRKYAISVLNQTVLAGKPAKIRGRKPRYGIAVKQALLTLWYAANRICSKRLAPFIPELISVLEGHGHLKLSTEVRARLLSISVSTIDRILVTERQSNPKSISTTSPGSLLKKQIQIRTFADWDDVTPGFMEADLVAHCGGCLDGSFLNTLTLIDIASGWLELVALLHKSSAQVIGATDVVRQVLPFTLLGLDTDNGSEFINYELLNYCEKHEITFTRSRAYRKNDQAHVEEKNGSVVRRLIGYERFEGEQPYRILIKLYSKMRLYVNFFQPSMKLKSKIRDGSKTSKKYEEAQTAYQRLLNSTSITAEKKLELKMQYKDLDPISLLKDIEKYQCELFKLAWVKPAETNLNLTATSQKNIADKPAIASTENDEEVRSDEIKLPKQCSSNIKKPRKKLAPRTWRTRKDPFEEVWSDICVKLVLNPHTTAKELMDELIVGSPDKFKNDQLRTLQRRVANWRKEQSTQAMQQLLAEVKANDPTKHYISVATATEEDVI